MAIEMKPRLSICRTANAPYMNGTEREERLNELGYSLQDIPIPQITGHASLLRRKQHTVFATISNAQEQEAAGSTRAVSRPGASRPGVIEGGSIDRETKIHPNLERKARRCQRAAAEEQQGRGAAHMTRPPIGLHPTDGRKRPWIVRAFRKLYPAHEQAGARFWRTASYLMLTWIAVFWLVWLTMTLVNADMYSPVHIIRQTYVVGDNAYVPSAHLQNNTYMSPGINNARACEEHSRCS